MRALAPSDLSTAARALMRFPEVARATACKRMLEQADAADRYRKRFGAAHSLWGNGTLEAIARLHPLAAPAALRDHEYLACLSVVIEALLLRRREACD
jgi:hypothetical protein